MPDIDPDRYGVLVTTLARLWEADVGEGELDDYLADTWGRYALACIALFCLPVAEIDGMVLQMLSWPGNPDLASRDVRRALERFNGNTVLVEDDFNYIDLGRVFRSDNGDMDEANQYVLAGFLRDAWTAWLHHVFRDRHFTVRLLSPEETGDGVGITFHQNR